MSINLDLEFQRAVYRSVVEDLRRILPAIRLSDAWVYHFDGDHWEFHYGDFYWHGSAGGAFDARSNGWLAYMEWLKPRCYRCGSTRQSVYDDADWLHVEDPICCEVTIR